MRRWILSGGAALSLIVTVSETAASYGQNTRSVQAQSPEAFVRTLYAKAASQYAFEHHFRWETAPYLAKNTLALKQRMDALYPGEEPAFMDMDWLCQCQEIGFKLVSVTITDRTPVSASATVRYRFDGMQPSVARLLLVNERGWKVRDIESDGRSYVAVLQSDIRSAHH